MITRILRDRHYGEWLQLWNELSLQPGLKVGYDNMVGNTIELTGTGLTSTEATTLYIPLQFWFCRNPGLALPLIALQYHEVRINVEFRPKNQCYISTLQPGNCGFTTEGSTFCVPSLEAASLFVDYIYLDTDERRRFAQLSHEYLIEQLQFTGDESTVNTNTKVKLNFNHPCKELIWVVQRDDVVKPGSLQWFNYTDDFDNDGDVTYGGANVHGQSFTNFTSLPFNLLNSNVEAGYMSQSFPYNYVQDGSSSSAVASLGVPVGLGAGNNFNVPSSFYPNVPGFVQANGLGPGNTLATDFVNFTGTDALTTAGDGADHAGLGPRNAGRNPVIRAKLQLNGHDRFQERLGSYFNLVQPYQCHTNIPATGINVYSFALQPELHQPSGTCNMSRIDQCHLLLQITPKAAYGSKVRVYATNYNVLIFHEIFLAQKSIAPYILMSSIYGKIAFDLINTILTYFLFIVLNHDASNIYKEYCDTLKFRENAKANNTKVILKNITGHEKNHGYSKNLLDVNKLYSKCAIRRKFSNIEKIMKTLQRVYICGVLKKNLKMYSSPFENMLKNRVETYVSCLA